MFQEIVNSLQGRLGFYMRGTSRELAISQDRAISSEVFGLEAVVVISSECETHHPGGATSQDTTVNVYLTQHEGVNSLEAAINTLKKMGYKSSVRRYVSGGLRRAMVSIYTNCPC